VTQPSTGALDSDLHIQKRQEEAMPRKSEFFALTPRVVRLELADLYVGGNTVAVQLDSTPCEAWELALASVLCAEKALAGITACVSGCWVHFTGVSKSNGAIAPQLLSAIDVASQLATSAQWLGTPAASQQSLAA
jgi:hypothetical protein